MRMGRTVISDPCREPVRRTEPALDILLLQHQLLETAAVNVPLTLP